MGEMVWRSVVDLPRDGTPIIVLYRDYDRRNRAKKPTVWRAEALMLGEATAKDGSIEVDWYCAGGWDMPFDSAKALEPHIAGWAPMPVLPE